MKKQNKLIEHLNDWEWTTLVASWRYYEYRMTIVSATFPQDIVRRYWSSGKYAKNVLDQIATQFICTDHTGGEKDWTKLKCTMECDTRPWCKFYSFLKAWLDGFTTLTLDDGKGHREDVEAFYCNYTKRWHPKDKYIKEPHCNYWCPDEYIKEKKEVES